MRDYHTALTSSCELDSRILADTGSFAAKAFLFFNWYYPLLLPEMPMPLAFYKNPDLCDMLSYFEVYWDENQMKGELRKQKRTRSGITPEMRAVWSKEPETKEAEWDARFRR